MGYRPLSAAEKSAFLTRIASLQSGSGYHLGGELVIREDHPDSGYLQFYDVREAGRQAIGIKSAARRLGVTKELVTGMIKGGNIPGYRTQPPHKGFDFWYVYLDVVQDLEARAQAIRQTSRR
jgi:hypothetical protein